MSDIYKSMSHINALYAWLPSESNKAYPISNLDLDLICSGTDVVFNSNSGAGGTVRFTVINKIPYSKSAWWKFWTWFDGHGTQKHETVNSVAEDLTASLVRGRDICIYCGDTNNKSSLVLLFCGVILSATKALTTRGGTGFYTEVEVHAALRDSIISQGYAVPTVKIDGSYGESKLSRSVESPKNVESDVIKKEIDGFLKNKALNVSACAATILDGSSKPGKYEDGSGTCHIRNIIDVDEDDLNARIELSSDSQAYALGGYLCKYLSDNCAGLTPYTAFSAAMQHFFIVPVPLIPDSYSVDRHDFKLRPGFMWSRTVGYELDTSDVLGYTMDSAANGNASSYFSIAVRYASPQKSDASDNVENFAMYVGGYENGKPWMLAGNEIRKKWFEDTYELKTGWFHFNKDLTNIKVYEMPAWIRHTQAWGASDDMSGAGTADPPKVYKNQKRWADSIAKQMMASLVRSGAKMYINVRYSAGLKLRSYLGEIIEVELPESARMANKASKMFSKKKTWYGYLSRLTMKINTTGQDFDINTNIELSAARGEEDQDVFSIPITKLYDID